MFNAIKLFILWILENSSTAALSLILLWVVLMRKDHCEVHNLELTHLRLRNVISEVEGSYRKVLRVVIPSYTVSDHSEFRRNCLPGNEEESNQTHFDFCRIKMNWFSSVRHTNEWFQRAWLLYGRHLINFRLFPQLEGIRRDARSHLSIPFHCYKRILT